MTVRNDRYIRLTHEDGTVVRVRKSMISHYYQEPYRALSSVHLPTEVLRVMETVEQIDDAIRGKT